MSSRRTAPTKIGNHIENIKGTFFKLENVTPRMDKMTLVAKTTLPVNQKTMTNRFFVAGFALEPTRIDERIVTVTSA